MVVFIVSALVHEKRQIEDIPPCRRERNKGEREREREREMNHFTERAQLCFF